MGSAKNHGDAAAVLKMWTAAEATRREVSECHEVFEVLGRVAMGPHDGPRDEAIEIMGLMCEDEKVPALSPRLGVGGSRILGLGAPGVLSSFPRPSCRQSRFALLARGATKHTPASFHNIGPKPRAFNVCLLHEVSPKQGRSAHGPRP